MINFSRRNGKPQSRQPGESLIEAVSMLTPLFDPAVELAQLQTADRGLNFGNAPVGSERFVQPTEPGCVLGVDKLIQE